MKTINTVALVCAAIGIAMGARQNDIGKVLFSMFLLVGNLVMRRWCE